MNYSPINGSLFPQESHTLSPHRNRTLTRFRLICPLTASPLVVAIFYHCPRTNAILNSQDIINQIVSITLQRYTHEHSKSQANGSQSGSLFVTAPADDDEYEMRENESRQELKISLVQIIESMLWFNCIGVLNTLER